MPAEDAIYILEEGEWWNWCDVPIDTEAHASFFAALDPAIAALRSQTNCPGNCYWGRIGRYQKCTSCVRNHCRLDHYRSDFEKLLQKKEES